MVRPCPLPSASPQQASGCGHSELAAGWQPGPVDSGVLGLNAATLAERNRPGTINELGQVASQDSVYPCADWKEASPYAQGHSENFLT